MEKYGISPITKWYVISELWYDVVIFHLDCQTKLHPCHGFSQVELPFLEEPSPKVECLVHVPNTIVD